MSNLHLKRLPSVDRDGGHDPRGLPGRRHPQVRQRRDAAAQGLQRTRSPTPSGAREDLAAEDD
jgi:hypothetical protein